MRGFFYFIYPAKFKYKPQGIVFALHILYFTCMLLNYWPFIVILFVCMLLSVLSGKLTTTASLAGGVIACLIFIGAGYIGVAMLATFFILGSAATVMEAWFETTIRFCRKK